MSILLPENAFETLKHDGFLLLKIPKAPTKVIRDTCSGAYRFFRDKPEEKVTSSLPSDLGYRPLAGEVPDNRQIAPINTNHSPPAAHECARL